MILCKGVRTHNLKNIDVSIPHRKWTAITGVSGSGKSSLAFDTIYAESQRRFLETLGTYERQFLQGLPQGDFDQITNIPAAIALKQSNKTGDPRSVIATAADLADPLRTLFVSFMEKACTKCGSPVKSHEPTDLLQFLMEQKKECLLSVPFEFPSNATQAKKLAQDLLLEGYIRLLVEGNIVELEACDSFAQLKNTELVLDRLTPNIDADEVRNRIETVWSQIRFSPRFSSLNAYVLQGKKIDKSSSHLFYVQPFCSHCNSATTIIQTRDLDWLSVLGACGTCQGLGNIPMLDEAKIIPQPQLSLEEKALKPWASDTFFPYLDHLLKKCKKNKISIHTSYQDLSVEDKKFIWEELKEFFSELEQERYKSSSRILLAKYRKYVLCPSCAGARVGEKGRHAICFNKKFHELFQCEIQNTLTWLQNLKTAPEYRSRWSAVEEVYAEAIKKTSLLVRLGLGSAHLFRRCKTLSGGEYQRVLLTRVIGNGLTDALYVLDEPSVGLGKAEIPELISCIRDLCALGNTIVMVEHDKTLVQAADHIIELGPEGGEKGGYVVEIDPSVPQSFKNEFTNKLPIKENKQIQAERFFKKENSLFLKGFSALNCQNVNLEVALGKLNVITGPSGAGKSTIVTYGLQAALEKYEQNSSTQNDILNLDAGIGIWKSLQFPNSFFSETDLVSVEQKSMHRAITSVPATILGLMDILRKHFSQIHEAKLNGFTASDFSFNGAGGCPDCGGTGVVHEDLFYLGEVDKVCPTCQGKRYRDDVLEVKWRGKNIAQWLSTSLQDCVTLLGHETGFVKPLHYACALGIGHLPLGIPTSSMSGGEAQRLRICAAIHKTTQKTFCILDEPTRGLSEHDIGKLLSTLLRLCQDGHTFVVVEHHPLFEDYAEHLIKMGPEGGTRGGRIVERWLRE